jgi:hypothetical protein
MKLSSRWKLLLSGAVLFVLVMGGYLWHDLHLGGDEKTADIPDVVIENIRINREVNGRKWLFTSPKVEHRDGVVYGQSLDVTITEKDGKKSHLKASSGTFMRENNDISLEHTNGSVLSGGRLYLLASGRADYAASGDVWNFSDDFMLAGGNVTVKCNKGSFNTGTGECRITDGGKVIWDLK